MLEKRQNNNNNKCALCGKILFSKKEVSKKNEDDYEEVLNGVRFHFDTKDCAIMFKRFRSVYGDSKFEELLGQEQYISDPFWNKVIPTEQEIREIEEQSAQSDNVILQNIRDPAEVQKLGFELIRSAKEEVSIIFSTSNAFHRQIRLGGDQLLREVSTSKTGLNIRILTPSDEEIK